MRAKLIYCLIIPPIYVWCKLELRHKNILRFDTMRYTVIWRLIPIVGLLLSLIMAPLQSVSAQASYSDINTISVDQHWIDITQLDDPDAFRVDEFIFINNTGTAPFGGSVQVWLPDNSQISAECCGGTPDMACRYHEDGLMECFYFLSMDGNRYVGYPFENSPNLSYYGQEVEMTMSVQSETNASNEDSINITAILGYPAIARTSDHNASGGIKMSTNNEVIGLVAILDMYMPYNITTHENITLTNNGTEEETFSLDTSELPDGWTASFWNETTRISNITIGPNETGDLFLIMTAPSYMATIFLSYTLELPASGGDGTGIFEKQYLYDNDYVEYYLFLLTEDGVQNTSLASVHPGTGDAASWDEGSQRFWSVLMGVDLDNNSTTSININIEGAQASSSGGGGMDLGMVLIFIGIIVLVVVMAIYLRRSANFDENDSQDDEDQEIEPEEDAKDKKTRLLEKKVMLQKLIERVDTDHENGLLSYEAAQKMKNSYEEKIASTDEAIQELEDNAVNSQDESRAGELDELRNKKKAILQSIKRIKMELEEGLINQDDFDKFNEAYRDKAKEIMRQMDER